MRERRCALLPSPLAVAPAHPHATCPSLSRRAPTLAAKATNQSSATVEVTHPATAPTGGWASLQLNVCLRDTPNSCLITNQTCTAQPPPATATNCTVGVLQYATNYTIQVRPDVIGTRACMATFVAFCQGSCLCCCGAPCVQATAVKGTVASVRGNLNVATLPYG